MFMCNLDIFYIYKIFKLTSTCSRTFCLLLLPAVPRSSRHVPALGQVREEILGYPGRGRNRITGDGVREGHKEKGALRPEGEGGKTEPVQDEDSFPEVRKGGSLAGGRRKKQ